MLHWVHWGSKERTPYEQNANVKLDVKWSGYESWNNIDYFADIGPFRSATYLGV